MAKAFAIIALTFYIIAANAANGCQLKLYQVQSRYWNRDRTRDLPLSSDIRSQDSKTQVLQCVMQLSSRRWQLGRNECLVFQPGSTSPCFIGTLRITCESTLQTASEITGSSSVHVWVESLNRHSNSCTVQHRVSNSTSFYRNWTEYVNGFGEGPAGNFWIGLENIYQVTRQAPKVLRIEMTLWNGDSYWASYSSFQIANAADQYRLISLGSFTASSAQLGNCMAGCLGQRFSTFDADFDSHSGSCSQLYKGGWWYNNCHCTNPNGIYFVPPIALNTSPVYATGVVWSIPFDYYYSMMEFKMILL